MLLKLLCCAFLFTVTTSCHTATTPASLEQKLVNTVWVPRTWQSPLPYDAELGRIRYADFTLLSFRAQGKCLLLSSYHSLGNGDTIFVATEPGYTLDSGRYQVEPAQVLLTTKNFYHTFTPPVVGNQYEERTDTLAFTGTYLVYEGTEYQPYTKLAGQRISSFWALLPDHRLGSSKRN
jgi:hypothetical protein